MCFESFRRYPPELKPKTNECRAKKPRRVYPLALISSSSYHFIEDWARVRDWRRDDLGTVFRGAAKWGRFAPWTDGWLRPAQCCDVADSRIIPEDAKGDPARVVMRRISFLLVFPFFT